MDLEKGLSYAWDIFKQLTVPEAIELCVKLQSGIAWDTVMSDYKIKGVPQVDTDTQKELIECLPFCLDQYFVAAHEAWEELGLEYHKHRVSEIPYELLCNAKDCPHRDFAPSYFRRMQIVINDAMRAMRL